MTLLTTPLSALGGRRLSLGGVIASEWYKLRTLRSTWWVTFVAVIVTVGVSSLAVLGISSQQTLAAAFPGAGLGGFGISIGVQFAQLAIAVLGALSMTSEYGSGMIRVTFAAVPKRLPVLVAKAVTSFVWAFVVGAATAVLSWVGASLILAGAGRPIDVSAEFTTVLWSVLGTGAYLGLVAVVAFSIGAIVRHSAGGIAVSVGLLFILPTVTTIVTSLAPGLVWVKTASLYLLDAAGKGMVGAGNGDLQQWQSAIIALVWATIGFVLAAAITRSRDL